MREYRNALMNNRRWSQLKPRLEDIFISTPAKCGTTWTQTIVGNLLWPGGVVARDGRDAFMSLVNRVQRLKNTDELNARAREEGIPEMQGFDATFIPFFNRWLADDDNFFHIIATYWERRA